MCTTLQFHKLHRERGEEWREREGGIVVWDRSAITIIKLTVPFELCVHSAVARKTERYLELLGACRDMPATRPTC